MAAVESTGFSRRDKGRYGSLAWLALCCALFMQAAPAFPLKLLSSSEILLEEPNPGDGGRAVCRASNGDVYAAGNIWGPGGEGVALFRYDRDLVLISSRQVGAYYGVFSLAVDLSGRAYLAAGNGDFVVMAFSPELELVSTMTLSGAGHGKATDITVGADGNIYVSGTEDISTNDKFSYLVKLSSGLTLISSAVITGSGVDEMRGLAVAGSGDVYVAGGVKISGNSVPGVFRFSGDLNLISSSTLNFGHNAPPEAVAIAGSGDIYIGGTDSPAGYAARFTSSLSFVSSAALVSPPGASGYVTRLIAAGAGLGVVGYVWFPPYTSAEIFTGKFSDSLVLESSTTFRVLDATNNFGYGVAAGPDGGLYVAGAMASRVDSELNSDFWIGKLNADLVLTAASQINGRTVSGTHGVEVLVGRDGNAYLSGSGGFGNSGWMRRYAPDLVLISSVSGVDNTHWLPMAFSPYGDLYLRGRSYFGNGIYRYSDQLQMISSASFTDGAVYDGRVRFMNDRVYIAGDSMNSPDSYWELGSDLITQATVAVPGAGVLWDIGTDENANLYVAGNGYDTGATLSGMLAKFSPGHVFVSSISFPAAQSAPDTMRAILVSTSAHAVYAAGTEGENAWVAKFDYDLNLVSSVPFQGLISGVFNTGFSGLALAPDGDLLVTGSYHNSVWLGKFTPALALVSSVSLPTAGDAWGTGSAVAASGNGDIYVSGSSGAGPPYAERAAWIFWLSCADEGAVSSVTPQVFSEVSSGSFKILWNTAPAVGQRYYCAVSTSVGFSGTAASSATFNNWASFQGLVPDTSYYARVFDPASGVLVLLGRITTSAQPPSNVSLLSVWESSASISWDIGANPSWTRYQVGQWFAGGSTGTATPISDSVATVALPEGNTTYIGVRAVGSEGLPSNYGNVVSVYRSVRSTTVAPGAERMLEYSGAYGDLQLRIPVGAFTGEVDVAVKTPASWTVPPPSGGLAALPCPVSMEILVSGGVQPSREVELVFSLGQVPSGVDERRLVVARYDSARGAWVPLPSRVDSSAAKIYSTTSHFSLFQVMQSLPASSLSGVSVGPNPLRPGRSGSQRFTFRYLPAGGRVRVFNYSGELLFDDRADSSGMAAWDARNTSGGIVASGVYLALVEGGGGRKIFKLVVER